MANKKDNARTIAQAMYMTGEYTQQHIAEFVGVQQKTVSNWVIAGNWNELRRAESMTAPNVVKNLYINIEEIQLAAKEANRPLSTKETDQIVKLSKTIKQLQRGPSLHEVVQVLKDFNKFVLDIDPKLVMQITELQKKYLYKLSANG